jgi:hypothetical protein
MNEVADRFWTKVEGGDVSECWQWTAAKFGPKGYGAFNGGGVQVRAHRWAYEALIAPIPAGLHIDHTCDNTSCVNPWHLEPVTEAENKRRGAIRRKASGRVYQTAKRRLRQAATT